MASGNQRRPLLVMLAEASFKAVGFDIDPQRRRAIRRGVSPIEDVPSEKLRPLVRV